MFRKILILALNVAVVLAVVGGTAAFADAAKHVTLVVDGQRRVVSTYADTVGELLSEQGVHPQPRDVVAPDVNAALPAGAEVQVAFARSITVDIDGTTEQVWTTASTVAEFVDQLGVRNFGAVLSASRSDPLPRSGAQLSIRLPDTLVIRHDGWRTMIVTPAPSVGAALRQARIRLSPRDVVSVPLSTPLDRRMAVTVTRVRLHEVRRRVVIPFHTLTRPDATLYRGQSVVVRAGSPGIAWAKVRLVIRDGKVVRSHSTVQRVLRLPTARIVHVGTTTRPVASSPSDDGLNWAALAQCESGGNPWAVNPSGYYGLYQFALGTWYGVGGTGNPIDASASEQTYRAQLLYARSGAAPWPVCGYLLYS